jgi:hypothetical protein
MQRHVARPIFGVYSIHTISFTEVEQKSHNCALPCACCEMKWRQAIEISQCWVTTCIQQCLGDVMRDCASKVQCRQAVGNLFDSRFDFG